LGVFANVLVGVVGPVLGFWIAGLLGIAPTGGIVRFLIALGGAVLLIFILGKLGVFRKT
jgi:uncharacterized membrane protein YeaQ/YmgE (transglycosylase-associated protein family)